MGLIRFIEPDECSFIEPDTLAFMDIKTWERRNDYSKIVFLMLQYEQYNIGQTTLFLRSDSIKCSTVKPECSG